MSAIIDLDLSFSLLSWAQRAISEERRRRFSTLSAEMCALSSSIFTLRVEFNLGEGFWLDIWGGGRDFKGYFAMCLLASRNRFLTEGGSCQSNVLRPAGFHKLTVLELEESVVLSYVYRDTRFPPAHCSVACGARVVWLVRRQRVDLTSNWGGMLRFSVRTTCSPLSRGPPG